MLCGVCSHQLARLRKITLPCSSRYFLYTFAFPRAFPGVVKFVEAPLRAKLCDRQGLVTLVKQVGFDQFVHHPFVVFPAFYLVKEWVEGGTVNAGLTKCRENWAQDCAMPPQALPSD